MSYNEIMQALETGQNVYWINSAYKVILDNHKLYTFCTYNEYMCGLQPSELKDCYIVSI